MTREMKNSGIEWIGQIPADWEITKHKYVMYKVKDICDKYNNEDILSLTMGGVIKRDLDNPTGKMPASFDGYQRVYTGNLLMCLFDIDVTPRCIGYIRDNGLTSPAYSQYVVNKGNAQYYDYLLRMIDDNKCFLHLSKNLRSSLTDENFGAILTVAPPEEEQQKIVEFLDEKIPEIDKMIAETKSSIESYKEYKQSIITEAVTKGLNKNVQMKDSGIEWIGEIPADWEVRKMKSFSKMISKGTTPKDMKTEIDKEYCIRYLKSENIVSNNLSLEPEFSITEETNEELKRSQLEKDDILFVIAGASIGKTAIVPEEFLPANTNQAVSFIRLEKDFLDYKKYIWYFLQSRILPTVIALYSVQSAQPNLSMENLGNIKLAISKNKAEIFEIVNYLDEKMGEIDNLIFEKEVLVSNLEEYKKSLIYEYVTGKKAVN